MSGERIDYGIERQRHDSFVGREALLGRLDELLTTDGADRWVVVTGGPGMGKSGLLAAWLLRRERAGAVVPHHFIRRGQYDWDDPAKLVSSLVAQLEERYADMHEPEEHARIHPAARLVAMLARVSASEFAHRGDRLVILIDGLDEYDSPTGVAVQDPLAAFLPHALPRGVSFLCASRPRHPYLDRLAERDGELVQIDLDEPDRAADNEATVRAFWECVAPALGLDARFVEEAVARAGGNLQHAAMLRKQLAALPAERRRVLDIPRGLAALLAKLWEHVATDPITVGGLGILCAARGALTLDELGAVATWTDQAQRQTFVRGARELLVETRRADSVPEYRLHHDSIRAHVAGAIGASALRGHHSALAQRLATWPPPVETVSRRYAMQYALLHRVEAGAWSDAWRLAADLSFLETKCRELGAHETEADVVRAAERYRESGDETLGTCFNDLARAIGRESHWLRAAPEATAALVWNRLRLLGWTTDDIDQQLQVPADVSFLRARHAVTGESPALVRDLVDHSDSVLACAVTADRWCVVTAAADRTLKVWDLDSGRALVTLQGHADKVHGCTVTPDGRRVVTASADDTLRIWDLASGDVLTTLRGHAAWVLGCAVTPDGRHVVSASADETLKVWDLDSGRALATLEGHSDWVRACVVTPDGRRVVSASSDGTLKVWELGSGRALATLQNLPGRVNACAVTADGRRVISASENGTLEVWDLDSGRALATLQGHAASVSACAVTPDGRRVVSASADKTLKVWDLDAGNELATLQGHTDGVNACAVTPDGRRVVSASADKTLKVWDLDSGRAVATPQGHTACVLACAVTPDGRRAISASADKTLKVWDLDSGRALVTLRGHDAEVFACAVIPDGRRVVSVSKNHRIMVWDLDSGRVLATLQGHANWANACAVTPDGRRVVSASESHTLQVWDLDSGRVLTTLRGRSGPARACAVTPDGRRLVSASVDGPLRVLSLESGRTLTTPQGHAGFVNACAITPDGRHVVSALADKTLEIWDLDSGRTLATLQGHTASVNACAVTPDGRRVVSASSDKTLRVWDLASGACLFTHPANASYAAVTATATTIIAGDITGGVWVLNWPSPNRRDKQRRSPNNAPSPAQPVKKHTILFLAANPSGTDQLALGQQVREIQVALERSGYRGRFELVTRWAARPLDLLDELRKLKPTVVHFSGHGSENVASERQPGRVPRRDVVGEIDSDGGEPRHGLFFQGPDGHAQIVSTAAITETFGAAGASVKLVVLNACYSAMQAEALVAHVDCVVGMGGLISDDAARSFAIGFYGGLGECESVDAAYKQGRAAIRLEGLREADRPQLKIRAGVDATKLILAADLQ